MKKKRNTYCLFHKSSAVFMILALVWLTVSTPFVTAFKQEMAKQVKMENTQSPLAGAEEDTNIPGSNTEEKTPASPTSFSEEYIHDLHTT
ncbi:MAG: hypothetical protein H7X88_11400, partial [Gloeobacteraceae cyanobacterium ES-bin-316]|nr:hypothetical protein [Ferruginibacter sp.]